VSRLCQAHPALRLSNLQDLLPFERPEYERGDA
jgi:hypothetical protein